MVTKNKTIDMDGFRLLHVVFKVDEKHFPTDAWPLQEFHQKKFMNEFKAFLNLYEIRCLGFVLISSHAHAIFAVPNSHNITAREVKDRYETLYGRHMDARSKECHTLQNKLNNISAFVKAFEWHYAFWYNRSGEERRKGSLWNPKFFRSELKDTAAMLKCWVYVQMNSVKANIVKHPSQHKFCTLGDLNDGFNQQCIKNLLHYMKELDPYWRIHEYEDFLKYLLLLIDEELEDFRAKGKEVYEQENSHWTKMPVIAYQVTSRASPPETME